MGVVVAGVAVHLLAAYLKPRVDRIGAWTSRSWSTRSEKLARLRLARITELRRDETAKLMAIAGELRCRIRATQFMFLAISFAGGAIAWQLISPWSFLNIVGDIAFVLSILLLLFGLYDHAEAMRIEAELYEATKAKEDNI